MTHRVFSRNAQSSRAIPIEKMIERVKDSSWYPIFMENKRGMSANLELSGWRLETAKFLWDSAKLGACLSAELLSKIGLHKQIVNRLLEPFSTIKVIVSSTEWDNFFSLRIAPGAQQEIQELAIAMKKCLDESEPTLLEQNEWHLPYIRPEDRHKLSFEDIRKISVARCARVSYLNHDKVLDYDKDITLYDTLKSERHLSPFEHVAFPEAVLSSSNFKGWNQLRSFI
jgi:hypothetical protein